MSLRMIEMIVRSDVRGELSKLPDELNTIGVCNHSLEDDLMLVRVAVPGDRSESVIRELESRFGHDPAFRIMVFEIQAIVPPAPEGEEDKPTSEPVDPRRIACSELVQKMSSGAVLNRSFLITVVLSTLVAAIGLSRNNVAIIIAAMVIAPLLAPNMTLALATTLGDAKLAKNALKVSFVGMSVALLLSVGLGYFMPIDPTDSEIQSRTVVSWGDLTLALAAGSAGALAFTTGVSASLVGVMVAVALLPPLVTAGLLFGAGEWQATGGSMLLLATNVTCLNIAGVGTFLLQGVRPNHWWKAESAKKMVRVVGSIWIVMLAIVAVLIFIARA